MIILIGSNNPSKKRALAIALMKLNFCNYEIFSYDVPSGVSSKPIGYEIIRGAENRNLGLKEIAMKEKLDYDYLVSIEGGFTLDENGQAFIVTYCISENQFGGKYTGKSLGVGITDIMYNYLKSGQSLNKVIEEMTNKSNYKQSLGIVGYLTNGIIQRDTFDSFAVLSSLIPFVYSEQRKALDRKVRSKSDK